jgi:hypothetical protein
MNFIRKFVYLFILAVFMVNLATAHPIFEAVGNGDSNKISDIQLKNGEAAVWYLFHAGWAVKTSSTLMIFDYFLMRSKIKTSMCSYHTATVIILIKRYLNGKK